MPSTGHAQQRGEAPDAAMPACTSFSVQTCKKRTVQNTPRVRRCSRRLVPTELADGLALRSEALLADHRGTRPKMLGPPLPGAALRGFGVAQRSRTVGQVQGK